MNAQQRDTERDTAAAGYLETRADTYIHQRSPTNRRVGTDDDDGLEGSTPKAIVLPFYGKILTRKMILPPSGSVPGPRYDEHLGV